MEQPPKPLYAFKMFLREVIRWIEYDPPATGGTVTVTIDPPTQTTEDQNDG
jgi:hypothetical protein